MRKRPHSRLIDDMLLHLDADESWLVLLALRRLEPAALAERDDAVVTILEDADWWVRILALETLGALGPAVLAQHVAAVVARLDDSESSVRAAALETLLGLEEAVLAQHAGAIFARLEAVRLLWDEDTEGLVRSATSSINRMLRTVGEQPPAHHIEALLDPDPEERDFALRALCKLEPATLAQHAVAIVAMLGEPTEKCQILQKLEPAALAQHADAVAAMLEDEDRGHVWSAALETLARLEPAVLAQYADAVAAKLEEHEAFEVWSAALVTLAFSRLVFSILGLCARAYWVGSHGTSSGSTCVRSTSRCTGMRFRTVRAARDMRETWRHGVRWSKIETNWRERHRTRDTSRRGVRRHKRVGAR